MMRHPQVDYTFIGALAKTTLKHAESILAEQLAQARGESEGMIKTAGEVMLDQNIADLADRIKRRESCKKINIVHSIEQYCQGLHVTNKYGTLVAQIVLQYKKATAKNLARPANWTDDAKK